MVRFIVIYVDVVVFTRICTKLIGCSCSAAVLADSQDFQACDQCFASLLSNVFFPLYKAIGIPIVMPPSPQGLTGIVSSTNWQGCDTLLPIVTEKLGNVSLTNLASCPQNKWGPMTIAATRKVDPGFLAGPPPVAE